MFNVTKYSSIHIIIGIVLLIVSFITLVFWDKNYGIDMTGGTQSEYTFEWDLDIDTLHTWLDTLKEDFNMEHNALINTLNLYRVAWEDKIVIEVWFNASYDEKALEELKIVFKENVWEYLDTQNTTFVESKYTNIGKSFGDYIKNTAIITLTLALIGITIYIAFAFYGVAVGISGFSFGLVVLFTQFLDVLVSTGLYVAAWYFYKQFQIDTFFITALLTILWYSLNNTIVVFDRVRENIKKFVKTKPLDEIINLSVHETTTRSIYTSLTLLFVLVAILLLGPENLGGFMLVMIFWVVFWVYSSLFIASSVLYTINKNNKLKVYDKKTITDEDKIVV